MDKLEAGIIQTEQCRYGIMSFFKNDNTISRSLRDYGEWAQLEVDLLRYLIDPGDIVIDVGAFIGTHTLAFAEKVGRQGRVYSFEPQPLFFDVLKNNVEQNSLNNVEVFQVAISDVPGTLELHRPDGASSGNFGGTAVSDLSTSAAGIGLRQLIDLKTLDQFGLHDCTLIKIDVESMEVNVLRGARQTLHAARPLVFAECNSLEYGWPVVEFGKQEQYLTFLFSAESYNPGNFRGSRVNFLGDTREAGLVLIPEEQVGVTLERLDNLKSVPRLIPIITIDDLALGLLKKPQYKQEVAAKSRAANILGLDFWANESEVRSFCQTIREQEHALASRLAENEKLISESTARQQELTRLSNERETLSQELSALEAKHSQTIRELRAQSTVLNQIYSSHGWKALSFYYKLRDKLFPAKLVRAALRGAPRRAGEGIQLLRDMRQVSASGLFDGNWYLRQNPDVATAHINPLRHYLRRGAMEGRDPNPLFDSDWYLLQNPDVARAGVNPLRHYLRHGAAEGRDPSPLFSTARYLQQHPEIAAEGKNPLAHYLRTCASEKDDRSRSSLRNIPVAPRSWLDERLRLAKGLTGSNGRPVLAPRPLTGLADLTMMPRDSNSRRLVCATHVLPYPPRAGNEYRIHRMLAWLADHGFEIFPVICPLPHESVTSEHVRAAFSVYPNMILCHRDGTLLYHPANEEKRMMDDLAGVRPREFENLLGEEKDPDSQRLLQITRTFCPDLLVEILLRLDEAVQPDVLLMEYIFMTRAFPLMRPQALKIVDTHDVFSSKCHKVVPFGVEDSLTLTPKEEASLLNRADVVIAIQAEEAEQIRKMVPDKVVVTAGVDFDFVDVSRPPAGPPVILLVASDNLLNIRGLKDFLRFAWPLIRREVPNVEFHVAGAVGEQLNNDDPSVRVLGRIDDLGAAYARARVVINPSVAGTGLKVKTIEALCHLRPIVVWPSGVEGLEADLRAFCPVATDWFGFALNVIELCKAEDCTRALFEERSKLRHCFAPDAIYAALGKILSAVPVGDR